MNLHSYPSIYNLGHRYVADLLNGPVIVEEKIDGSQFSFGEINGELCARSKGASIYVDAPEGMFKLAAEQVKARKGLLGPGLTYRGEYLAKPRHNGLAYDRIPKDNIIIFDINTDPECSYFMSPEEKLGEANRVGFEVVPHLFQGKVEGIAEFRTFLDRTSVLGGQKIEGVVVKPVGYGLFGVDKKVLMGKFVSEAYKEVQAGHWKQDNPKQGDIIERIAVQYGTQARWNKAIQHLREAGQLQDDPRDIGLLMKEVPNDVLKECESEIKAEIFKWAWNHVRRMLTRGLPEYYKEELLKKQFEVTDARPDLD